MPAYKRSDPKKLRREREEIGRSLGEFKQSPEDSLAEVQDRELDRRGYSGSPNLVGKVTVLVKERIARRRAKKAGYGPPPQREGAQVTGFQKLRSEA